jgi:N-acetylglutamate synthase-like GNAT family acetyltransferase
MLIRLAQPRELAVTIAIDDDASELYASAGIVIRFAADHPFVLAERERWRRCAEAGRLWLALEGDVAAGFAALEPLDGLFHLEQLSVRRAFMRRGVGTTLLNQAIAHADGPLTLTTYDHVPWNAPWYQRMGFRPLDAASLPPGLRARMTEEQTALPQPEHRIAMRRG